MKIMNGITINQYVDQLKLWNEDIAKKQILLDRGFKVYQFIYFVVVTVANVSNFLAAFLSSLVIGYSTQDNKGNLITILSAFAAAFSVIAIICNAINMVFKPQPTAEQAAFSSKCYADLYREISVEILSVHNSSPIDSDRKDDDCVSSDNELCLSFEKYKSKLLYYSSREQIISVNEPGLILIGYRPKNITTKLHTCSQKLSLDELEFISAHISTIVDDELRAKLEHILHKSLDVKIQTPQLVDSDDIEIVV
jgi:hypothetical protein